MTDREAMKMALDALTAHYQSKDEADVHRARVIQALEAALAQKQTKCPRCNEVNPAEIHTCSPQVAQPEQEPVAYLYHDTACAELANPLADSTLLVLACDRKPNGRNETPLYAAPPSKPDVNQELVEPQLHPKDVIKLALKAGFTKDAINVWLVSMEKLIAFAAPPKREWVGLTDEEIVACGWCDLKFARNIEAKHKEKNT